MGFWTDILPKKRSSLNKVLIDIDLDSVGGAYVSYREGQKPTILSTHRIPIGVRSHEPLERAMLSALHSLGEILIREGAPHLARATGTGAADVIVAGIDAPWASVSMRTKQFHPKEPIIFSEELVSEALSDLPLDIDELLADEEVIGSVLNGYVTQEPFGKEASRATVVALASKLRSKVAEDIAMCLRNLFHVENISLIASGSLHHQAARTLFMHEPDAAILDTMSREPSLMVIRRNVPVSLTSIPDNTTLTHEFKRLRDRLSLPRRLFILEHSSDQEERFNLTQSLASVPVLNVVPVRPSHLVGHVSHSVSIPPDLPLLLMALHGKG